MSTPAIIESITRREIEKLTTTLRRINATSLTKDSPECRITVHHDEKEPAHQGWTIAAYRRDGENWLFLDGYDGLPVHRLQITCHSLIRDAQFVAPYHFTLE